MPKNKIFSCFLRVQVSLMGRLLLKVRTYFFTRLLSYGQPAEGLEREQHASASGVCLYVGHEVDQFMVTWKSRVSTVSGLFQAPSAFFGGEAGSPGQRNSRAEYEAHLRHSFPTAPQAWLPLIADQLLVSNCPSLRAQLAPVLDSLMSEQATLALALLERNGPGTGLKWSWSGCRMLPSGS